MKEKTIMPGEFLFKEGEICEEIYFINKGLFEVLLSKLIMSENEEILK